ncbi:Signal transduction histidine kinase [Lachnospiraceae bacterium XPB1003]|nr:Signal transduction histidine kinase [Lachnospiraceae bacterium XPB1003]
MRRTLYVKLLAAYLIFAVFGYIVVATFMQQMTMNQVEKEKAEALYRCAASFAENEALAIYKNELSLTNLKDSIDRTSKMLDSAIFIVNPSGLIVASSESPLDVDKPYSITNFDVTALSGSFYNVGNFYGEFDTPYLTVACPVTSGYLVHGYVIVSCDMKNVEAAANHLVNIDYIFLLILFLLSLIILIFFTELVYLPLRRIIKATEQYASGNLHYDISVDSDDEIGYLAASLAYMAQELAKGEDNQKQIVANVSHDFRSPLTSIKGYLEAMQDGTIPEEMYPKYIGIVINESDRLIKLTNNLLTLNNLNTRGMVLDITDFDINNVIRQTVSTFEGICRSKTIAIELTLTGDLLYVHADLGKIQQVIYNLLDNAIKFSHRSSVIKIETTEKHQKVFVSVKDEGIGIPKESVPHVFDRFYKSDLSRGKDKKGTGLGLSITKEIIRAHSENINVISTEGVGTEFIFSLPLSDDANIPEEDED